MFAIDTLADVLIHGLTVLLVQLLLPDNFSQNVNLYSMSGMSTLSCHAKTRHKLRLYIPVIRCPLRTHVVHKCVQFRVVRIAKNPLLCIANMSGSGRI